MPAIFTRIADDERKHLDVASYQYDSVSLNLPEVALNDLKPHQGWKRDRSWMIIRSVLAVITILPILCMPFLLSSSKSIQIEKENLKDDFPPFSVMDPRSLGVFDVERVKDSRPGKVFGKLVDMKIPIPTNLWCENLLLGATKNDALSNRVYVIPYIVDTAGPIKGLRTHPVFLKASDISVLMEVEPDSGVTLGSVEIFDDTHEVLVLDDHSYITHIALHLEWRQTAVAQLILNPNLVGASIRTAIVRGSPYSSMEYIHATPRLVASQTARVMTIDKKKDMKCDDGESSSFLVKRELTVRFINTDHSWMIFVSEPTRFYCKQSLAPFELVATAPMKHGMVRIALANNCTTGLNRQNCNHRQPTNSTVMEALLSNHADVYPTGKAHVKVAIPTGLIEFDFAPALMSTFKKSNRYPFPQPQPFGMADESSPVKDKDFSKPEHELLMFALPHHRDQIIGQYGSTNVEMLSLCVPTLQGDCCLVSGSAWLLREDVPEVRFNAPRPIRPELLNIIRGTVHEDLKFEVPLNYRRGAGDTYFSGKILAKLARILLVAEEVGVSIESHQFKKALNRLKEGTEIWLNGSAKAPFLYDSTWGGLISCGCNYDGEDMTCFNTYPDCPSLGDPGQNFGNAFYNDHHFHYGYHIYAAAVVVKFDHVWGRKFHENVMLLIRDIANPSHQDPFFPTWRHKDWFIGSSWANGVIGVAGVPNPNGRNEESSAEAIAAYEAVALYGRATAAMFSGSLMPGDGDKYVSSLFLQKMGELLMGSEISSTQRYWHVSSKVQGVPRIYPDIFISKIVGMVWSMLVQRQTWFGGQPWKSYGIQLLTITPASEQRDDIPWVREMLPEFNSSCYSDPVCMTEGWSILVSASQASLCDWKPAGKHIMSLPESVFESAGGNGQSRSNSMWWVATRDCP